ncbi:uncharacterized protein LOC110189687 [Drosophila serrata]|uniref:uncharacterized protein LOC110189687 n=1 Tax=Drosophila serrata TaxID=7274 RepID=UPI000A1D2E67|nr:uncharacterized protein LOC110189687 [Drosophila serrata]
MLGPLFLLIAGVSGSWAADYELLLEDPDIVSPCTEPAPGSLHFADLFNMDDFVFQQDADIIRLNGNLTSIWDVQPTDRISARFSTMHFERGNWEPTVFSVFTPDFCSMMFDEERYWFKYWTSFISNREEIEEKCIRTRGTVLVHIPFDFRLFIRNISAPNIKGRYKLVSVFEAFDENDIRRQNSICFEIRGEVDKVKK